jgi:Rha family phage regulatory protein
MDKLMPHPVYDLYERSGKPYCSTLQVAETFEKRHDDVLKSIRNLDCSNVFRLRNFAESSYLNEQKKKQPMFIMTKDGFMFLVMGYRGKKAAAFKEAYIQRFNDMETFIAEQYAAKMEFPEFTRAVMMAHDEPKSYHFSNECNMINQIVLGQSAKQFKESRGLVGIQSIRPYLSNIQITDVHALQMADVGLLIKGVPFQERKAVLTDYQDRRKIIELSA